MATVLEQIRAWARDLDFWEQAALDKIVSGAALRDLDYTEILQYLVEDAGLAKRSGARPTLQFPCLTAEEANSSQKPVRLTIIFSVRNVNALVSDQQITFGSQLTVIFGAN